MTQQSFNEWWEGVWSERIDAANRNKDPNDAWVAMVHEFAMLPPDTRPFGDVLIADWLRSPDARRRFVALAIVADVPVPGVTPALTALADRLRRSADHEAPFELAKVEACLARAVRRVEGEASLDGDF